MRERAPPVPTLEDMPALGVTHIRVWCGRWPNGCTHEGRVAVAGIDLTMTIVEFAAKLKCEVCGTVGGQAMPQWREQEQTQVWDPVNWLYVPVKPVC